MATEPDAETRIARGELGIDPKNWGYPSLLTCPDCGGVLLQLKDEPLRFRCHTGHAFTAATLAATLREKSDDRLWTALRVLQEQKFLLQQGAPNDGDNDDRAAAMSVIEQAEQSLRRVILEVEIAPPETSAGGPAKKRPESR
jgi:two-component system chemotaxis response regulator CheB